MRLFIVVVVRNASSCGALWAQLHQANGPGSHNVVQGNASIIDLVRL